MFERGQMKKHKHIIVFICLMLCLSTITGCTNSVEKEETETSEEEIVEESLVKTVEFDGKQMDYIRFGNKDGNTLVILPGLSLKSVMGAAEAIVGAYSLLAEDHEIYLFDHIREEKEGYGIDGMVEDTLKAFELLNIKHADLMGVSMGGMVAQTIALKRSDVVDSLILCSTTSNVKDLDHSVFENWKKLAEERDVNGLMESFGEKVYSPDFYAKYKDIIIAGGQGVTEQDYVNFLTSLKGISEFDVSDKLEQIKCPVLVMGAGEDQVVGVQSSLDIVDKLGCKYFIYEGYGHGVYDEAPDYLSHIKEFLDEQ